MPRCAGADDYWIEGRPAEAGRQVLVRSRSGKLSDLTPVGLNARSTVHEYGGGDYVVAGERAVFSDAAGGAHLQSLEEGCAAPLPGSSSGCRYADFAVSPDGRFVAVVEEEAKAGDEPTNRMLVIEIANGARRVVDESYDFVSSPCFAPDGSSLAYLGWNHPHMPWQGTELRRVPWSQDGPGATHGVVAGGSDESIFQPSFSPDGHLTFVSDRTGWWNLYRLEGEKLRSLAPRDAEFGQPQWVFGMRTYGYRNSQEIVGVFREGGFSLLFFLAVGGGELSESHFSSDAPLTDIDAISVEPDRALLIAGGPNRARGVLRFELATGETEQLAGGEEVLEDAWISRAESRSFATGASRAHGFFYAPKNPLQSAPAAAKPPLLVRTHGGPTASSGSALDLSIQYFTSRGFAVFDVNYRGSTGYGRDYRLALAGQWGVIDREDCEAAALDAVRSGDAHPTQLAIRGGSAGGYTTLCALTFGDVFRAGASHYGIGDLSLLARDTHKFESRYTDWLVGPYPESQALYRERSPLHHSELLTCPVIFFQGSEDRVVPPNQAETMVEALAARGILHEYHCFEGEGHGFRHAKSIIAALEGELAFYRRVFGL